MNETLIGIIAGAGQLQGTLTETKSMSGSFNLFELPEKHYSGAYVFTPSDTIQTIPTAYTTPISDITINPIPSNYGLITYDGTVITVS